MPILTCITTPKVLRVELANAPMTGFTVLKYPVDRITSFVVKDIKITE